MTFLYPSEHDYGSVFNTDERSDKSDVVKPKNKSFFSLDTWGYYLA
jgi:hypothetical protein